MRKRVYKNETPIDAEMEVLRLLIGEWNDRTVRKLYTRIGEEPYLEVAICTSGYTGDMYTRSDYYKIARAIVLLLRNNGYVEGTPYWGYTDYTELRVSEYGKEAFYKFVKKRREGEKGE
ncbi:MAG: hypothetical protein HZA35_00865 [Parcubacteria group bacterium]|nr:hypothetical protein [Parcubacteria group bacterium]